MDPILRKTLHRLTLKRQQELHNGPKLSLNTETYNDIMDALHQLNSETSSVGSSSEYGTLNKFDGYEEENEDPVMIPVEKTDTAIEHEKETIV